MVMAGVATSPVQVNGTKGQIQVRIIIVWTVDLSVNQQFSSRMGVHV